MSTVIQKVFSRDVRVALEVGKLDKGEYITQDNAGVAICKSSLQNTYPRYHVVLSGSLMVEFDTPEPAEVYNASDVFPHTHNTSYQATEFKAIGLIDNTTYACITPILNANLVYDVLQTIIVNSDDELIIAPNSLVIIFYTTCYIDDILCSDQIIFIKRDAATFKFESSGKIVVYTQPAYVVPDSATIHACVNVRILHS